MLDTYLRLEIFKTILELALGGCLLFWIIVLWFDNKKR